MQYKITTYKTLMGTKDILEINKRKSGQWIVYQDDKPKYLVDCFDFKTESNLIMNNLILSEGNPIDKVIKKIKKKNKVDISLPKVPIIEIEVSSKEVKGVKLAPLPEEWLV